MYQLLLRYQTRFALRFFIKNRGAKLLTVIGFFAAFALLVTLCYESFYYGFKYIAQDAYFGEAVTIYVVELFFLISFILVYVSALMSGLFAMFRSVDDIIILASPSYQLKLVLVMWRMLLSSLWPLLVVILPGLIAFHQVFSLSLLGLFFGLLSSVLMIAAANVFAVVTVLLVADIIDALGHFSVRHTILGTFGVLLLLLTGVWMRFRSLDLISFFQARMIDTALPDLTPILHQFKLFPSHFSALTIFYSQLHQYANALFALGYTALFLALFSLSFLLLKSEYLGLWQKGQKGSQRSGHKVGASLRPLDTLFRTASSPSRAILRKEIVTFFRNTRGILWALFIMFIWAIQNASSKMLSHGLGGERVSNNVIPASVSSLQFAVILYFVAMFVLRFAFPSFSAERKSTWTIRSAPVDFRSVFVVKLFFFSILFGAIAFVFTLSNALSLGLLLPLGLPLLFAVLLGTFFLTTFGLSLGVIFPNTETDDPERLSTTLPGIGFIICALLYGAFGAYALKEYFLKHGLLLFSLFIFCSLSFSLFSIIRANHALMHEAGS